jgi:anti-sigma regulatory factor (Ser/Thr protein kinase)
LRTQTIARQQTARLVADNGGVLIRLVLEQASLGESGTILVRSKLRAVMQRMGFTEVAREQAELVCTEMLTNQHKYAQGTGLYQIWESSVPAPALDLFAIDFGPGIPELHRAFEDGFTTSGTMGRGLGAIRRLAHECAVYSLAKGELRAGNWHGVAVWARFYRDKLQPWPYQIGAFLRAYNDDPYNGDCICVRAGAERVCWLHMDGLGHGLEAAETVRGLDQRLEPDLPPEKSLERISGSLRGGRGAVGLVGMLDAKSRRARLCGVGDMSAALLNGSKHPFTFAPGILGHAHRRFETSEVEMGDESLLLTASDGLRSGWNERTFPGLWQLPPQLVALLLGNVAGRTNDDRSIFVTRPMGREGRSHGNE